LEKITELTQAKLTFPVEGVWRYRIEISEDGSQWKPVVNQVSSALIANECTNKIPSGKIARFVRITFIGLPSNMPAALSEVQFTGHQPPRWAVRLSTND